MVRESLGRDGDVYGTDLTRERLQGRVEDVRLVLGRVRSGGDPR